MSTPPLVIQGRDLTEEHILEIRRMIAVNPGWSRYRLSIVLATSWDWRNEAGRLKDMAARTLMLKLDQRGLITLPPPRGEQIKHPAVVRVSIPEVQVQGPLADLRPIQLDLVDSRPERRLLAAMLIEHHYLGYKGHVGENLSYIARDRHGRLLGCLLFGAAAWKAQQRDDFIGWAPEIRERRLSLLTSNTRFLILPWVRVKHLASHLLGRVTRRLSTDWVSKYRHPVHLVETFVDRSRFLGTSYKAANWSCLGKTAGRGRQDRKHRHALTVKDLYVRPLTPAFREILGYVDA